MVDENFTNEIDIQFKMLYRPHHDIDQLTSRLIGDQQGANGVWHTHCIHLILYNQPILLKISDTIIIIILWITEYVQFKWYKIKTAGQCGRRDICRILYNVEMRTSSWR